MNSKQCSLLQLVKDDDYVRVDLLQAVENPPCFAIQPQKTTLATTLSPFMSQLRLFQTGSVMKDIDQAAKYIGAGAATVGVAGSGQIFYHLIDCTKVHIVNIAESCLIFIGKGNVMALP